MVTTRSVPPPLTPPGAVPQSASQLSSSPKAADSTLYDHLHKLVVSNYATIISIMKAQLLSARMSLMLSL